MGDRKPKGQDSWRINVLPQTSEKPPGKTASCQDAGQAGHQTKTQDHQEGNLPGDVPGRARGDQKCGREQAPQRPKEEVAQIPQRTAEPIFGRIVRDFHRICPHPLCGAPDVETLKSEDSMIRR